MKKNENLKKLQKIQDLCEAKHISLQLPKLVVVGPQSSGKSSVLEQLIQREILPRGNNLVTRCPIVVHIRPSNTEYAHFAGETTMFALSEVKKEIEKRMIAQLGNNQGIGEKEIVVFLLLKNGLAMTLVDLPGFTKLPKGDQPKDIEQKIEKLVLEYCAAENTFILAIVNANVDIVNSEALKLASEVDPKGTRTLGVVTKVDLMDAGTNCLGILTNTVHKLPHGYIGVVNRSQTQICGGVDFSTAIKNERLFFSSHSVYKKLGDKTGTHYLLLRLHEIFLMLIDTQLPRIEESIYNELSKCEVELKEFGDDFGFEEADKNNIATNYGRVFYSIEVGAYFKSRYFVSESGEGLMSTVKKRFNEIEDLRVEEVVAKKMKYSDSLLVSERILREAFELKLQHFKKEMFFRIERITDEIVNKVENVECVRSKKMGFEINKFVQSEVIKNVKIAKGKIENYFDINSEYLNFDHSDFSTNSTIVSVLEKSTKVINGNDLWSLLRGSKGSKIEIDASFEYKLILRLIEDYYVIFKKGSVDYAIKSVYFYVFGRFGRDIVVKLNNFFKTLNVDVFSVDPEIKERKIELEIKIENLSNVIKEISKIK